MGAYRRSWESVLPEPLTLALASILVCGMAGVAGVAAWLMPHGSGEPIDRLGSLLAQSLARSIEASPASELKSVCTAWSQTHASAELLRSVECVAADGALLFQWSDPAHAQRGRPFAAQGTPAGPLRGGTVRIALDLPTARANATLLWVSTAGLMAAALLAFFLIYRRLRRHVGPASAIEQNLRSIAAGLEQELSALTLSESLGPSAGAWNQLIEQLTQLKDEAARSSGPAGDVAVMRLESRTLRGILNRLPVGVLRIGLDGRIVDVNTAALALCRATDEKLRNQPVEALEDEELARWLRGLAPGASTSLVRTYTDAAREISLRFQACACDESSGGQRLLFVQDVTALQDVERARDKFLYHVTHELRTPLTNIQAYVETLTKPEFDDEQTRAEAYNVIVSETRRLSRLVEDILSVSQLEVGSAHVARDDVDLVRLVRQIVQDNLGGADEKKIDLRLALPPKVPKILGDKERLAVLLNNLIGNAVKYTPAGGEVTVEVKALERFVRIAVKDSGIGIAPEEHEKVFEKFYRSSSEEVLEQPGTGLGLAISREIARAHGGEIRLESTLGAGSTFEVELPLPVSAAARAQGETQ